MGLRLVAVGILFALLGCAPVEQRPTSVPSVFVDDEKFRRLAGEFLGEYYRTHPVRATHLGIHAHDARLPNFNRQAIVLESQALREWMSGLQAIDRNRLSVDTRYDHRILEHAIRGRLLELDEVAGWRHNPMIYVRAVADGVASLVDRRFAPLSVRLQDLIARLDGIPQVTKAARENLRDVPRLWAELAVNSGRGAVRFLRDDVPRALAEQGLDAVDPQLLASWERAHERSLERLGRFNRWLEEGLLPRANGDFRLGEELFERKLFYDEHFSLSIEALRERNEAAIADYTQWIEREARRLDTSRSTAEIVEAITRDHPASDELIPTARRFVEQAREFVVEREIVTLPSDDLPIVRPTPAFARTGFASMSAPGPFETVATRAFYNITTADPAWTPEQESQHLTYFNYPGLLGISVHEVMPGHYVQLLYRQRVAGDIRKVFMPSSFVEGWAHYTEQMMVDEGLGDGDPVIRVGQLRRALQRHARWDAALALHAFGESVAAASARFEKIAFFAPFPALRETQRATYNPTYLYYALGRMEILRLREDYRRRVEKQGRSFSLREFHDRLLQLGLPIPLARQVMLSEESPVQSSGSIPRPSASRL